MATVVQTSEEDAALTVVRFASELAWADAGPEVPIFTSFTTFSFKSLCCFGTAVPILLSRLH